MRRDKRLRQIQKLSFTAEEGYALPSDFGELIEIYHDGDNNYGPLASVSEGELSTRKARFGATGVPYYVAVNDDTDAPTLSFAPEPTASAYTLTMKYLMELDALSDANTTNWLLEQAPDLYMWATLRATEGYLVEDARIAVWSDQYEQAANEFERYRNRREYSGALTPRPMHTIGGNV